MQDFKESLFSVGLPLISALGVGLFTLAFTGGDEEFPMLTPEVKVEEDNSKLVPEKDLMSREEAQELIDALKTSILLKFEEESQKTPSWSTELMNDVKSLTSEVSSMKNELKDYKEANTILLNKLNKKIQNIHLNPSPPKQFDVALQKEIILASILLFCYQFDGDNKLPESSEQAGNNSKESQQPTEVTLLASLKESLKKHSSIKNFSDPDNATSVDDSDYFTSFDATQTSKLNAGIDMLNMYIRNVLKQDDKFLTISTNNTAYKTSVKNLKHVDKVLTAIGFKYVETNKSWKFMWKDSMQNKKKEEDDESSEESSDIIPKDLEDVKTLLSFCSTHLTNLKKSRDEFLTSLSFVKVEK